MKYFIVFLLSCFVLSAAATGEDGWGFDAPLSDGNITADWYQNKSDNFKPFGAVELIDGAFGKHKKALRIVSTEKSTDVVLRKTFPAKIGDTFAVSVVFRSPDGKSRARVGLYGYGKRGEYQAYEFSPADPGWDQRTIVFEIRNPETEKVAFFIAGKTNSTIEYSQLHVKKLLPSETGAYTPGKMRALWTDRTKGVNLARGRKAVFFPAPNCRLTTGKSDETDLTDGKLGKPNDMLWFDQEAVGWYRALHGATIFIDLGSVQPLRKAVIRINGGRPLGWGAVFPEVLEAWVSRDGKNYHLAHSMKKVAPSESNMADWKELYYLPESCDEKIPTYVYPFELNLNSDARYVAVRAPIYTAMLLLCDELAVMKATPPEKKNPEFNRAYEKIPRPLMHQNVIIQPKLDCFYVDSKLKLPNWLGIDSRLKEQVKSFSYTIDLPEQISYTEDKGWPAFIRTFLKKEKKDGRAVYHFQPKTTYESFLKTVRQFQFGPFFFSADGKRVPEKEKYVVFTTFVNGKLNHSFKMPLEILNIQEVPTLKRLNISLAWTENRHFSTYPEYLDSQSKLGFNTLPVFPISKDAPQVKQLILEAKKRGYLIRHQMSPSGKMISQNKKETEMFCIGGDTLCPAYRGRLYVEMIDGIREAAREYPADFITFDEEKWGYPALRVMLKCSRCDALRKEKKLDWKNYIEWAMADYLSAFKKAVAVGIKANGRKMPLVSFYALVPPASEVSGAVKHTEFGEIACLGYPYLWPKHADEIQDSYYGRDSRTASMRARNIFRVVKNPAVICPWITGGSGAHTETAYPERTGQHLIETLMNGAGGIQYFMYPSFESPLDYYYHARAMRFLQPYEDILMDGALDFDFSGSDKSMCYTARILGKKTLVLVGNYNSRTARKSVMNFPETQKVTDITANGANVPIDNGSVEVTVPADDYLLLLMEK